MFSIAAEHEVIVSPNSANLRRTQTTVDILIERDFGLKYTSRQRGRVVKATDSNSLTISVGFARIGSNPVVVDLFLPFDESKTTCGR